MNQRDNDLFLDTAILAAKSASKIILESNKKIVKTYKGLTDLVTATDIESETAIIDIIQSNYPKHNVLAEESGKILNESDYTWIVDPLDGTTNFVHNYPFYGVSIALFHDNEVIVGVVIELPSMNIYRATNSSASYCNDDLINVSGTNKLLNSLLVTGFGYVHEENWQKNMKLFKLFTDVTQGVRRSGSAAIDLCHAASGKVDGYWEYDLSPWDVAAGSLIAKQAGAMITDFSGEKFSIYENQVLVSNKKLHKPMINILKKII